ncbi:MAG: isoamylase early set domain-containing protein [Spirochaetes bacterium]|nr:isoamylase early set domain-containing protein [Spirochaetota bacterium]
MLKKDYSRDGKYCVVTFVLASEAARNVGKVNLVGDFNDWNLNATTMSRNPDGSFEAAMRLEAGREYLFRYFLDGERWENDWNADKYFPSPYKDSQNSVVIV